MKIKFKGKSDNNFTKGKIYQLVKIENGGYYDLYFSGSHCLINTLILNKNKKVVFIPYWGLEAFNENWEVINE